MLLKVIIIDDEPLAVNVIKNYVDQIKELTLEKTFPNAVAASLYLCENEVDIIFLDINMPVINGMEFIKSLKNPPMIVLTTAHAEYALEGFELEAIDYLIKPISFPRFLKSVNRIIQLRNGFGKKDYFAANDRPSIFVKVDKKKLQKIYIDEILVIESLKDYIQIKTTSGRHVVHRTLSSFTNDLPNDTFIRIHRSYTISINKIEVVEGNSVEIDKIRYTIGRSYVNDVKSRIFNNTIL
ncbi:DNA-binding LytR/AlgR family response regulator [Saonia flava]|uniref:DNA-binding LytR/AlgR family response regulator n=1 Tax=Saonia flava TaxID=523696 RepID=A0A846QYZ5_9FLAO|nr:LytTR family DNA-binding domain-containing protein [Saonia flava]NJB70354.1 DNA-binding LytR/AlgR family response regulator [Saonia flava]